MILLLAACGGVESGVFVTYNAGLATGFVPGSDERRNATAAAIAEIDADVICLQEVWTPEQIAAVESTASTNFPNSYFPAAQQEIDAEPACPNGQLDTLEACATASCGDVCSDELVGCIFDACALQFALLPKDCQRCTMANVGGELQDVIDACETQATEYAYGGSFGTGLLSRVPLTGTEELVFDSTSNRRSALHAVAELDDGPVDVYCTHLTAAFDSIPYPRDEGGWDIEQELQILDLRDWIDSTSTHPVVVMGDFNVGPAGDGLVAEEPENYDTLVAGYSVPYVDESGVCTFCADNPLIALGNDDAQSELIDHILVKGWEETEYTVSRVGDGPLTHGVCGVEIEGAFSDHYGVRVGINKP